MTDIKILSPLEPFGAAAIELFEAQSDLIACATAMKAKVERFEAAQQRLADLSQDHQTTGNIVN